MNILWKIVSIFVEEVFNYDHNLYKAGLNGKSLFTNIPLK